jgi:DNA invertase Pin-like site-specific DNA recombinase
MRCAIYTQKSTDEGLERDFNSLDAQRESAEAYILSQRHAGWTTVAERYDDGGYTGANLARPALERLLADIEVGLIDCVLVYKVDRLSRSLLDFARLMSTFEQRGVNLVSVTQQFNTTTSMGRLTLNILLSFAEFERSLIVERTRDKMAAARHKGKWVGGLPVLGYDVAPGGGRLLINGDEADQVRTAFALYLEHGALLPVLDHIHKQQWTTKRWTTQKGRLYAGRAFTEQDLQRLLTNTVYTGRVLYKGQIYEGEHAAIVEESVWQRAQVRLGQKKHSQAAQQPSRKTALRQPRLLPSNVGEKPETDIPPAPASSRVPRITRLMALAVKFEGLIEQGVVRDYAALAKVGQVSRARVTQIMNLLNLAPDIQEEILSWVHEPRARESIRETSIRTLSSEVMWNRQREQWKHWFANRKIATLPSETSSQPPTLS